MAQSKSRQRGITGLRRRNSALRSLVAIVMMFGAPTIATAPNPLDIKGFQTACGFEEAAQTNVLDVRTINALLGIDTKAGMIAKPKKKS